jgi:hypothetical protein
MDTTAGKPLEGLNLLVRKSRLNSEPLDNSFLSFSNVSIEQDKI